MGITIHWNEKEEYKKEQGGVDPQKRELILDIFKDAARLRNLEVKERKETDYPSGYKGIYIIPHKDCEWFEVSFDSWGHIPDYNFCKTQFAGVKAHILVCDLLKILDYYIPLEIFDEGEYWGKKDKDLLRSNLGENMAMIQSLGKQLKDEFGDKGQIMSSLDDTKGWVDDFLDYKIKQGGENEKS